MLMLVSERSSPIIPATDRAEVPYLRTGDILRFGEDRAAVELVLGFRPGIDKLLIVAGARPSGHRCLLTIEEAGAAVVIDGRGRRIVLQGVPLATIEPGDIALAA